MNKLFKINMAIVAIFMLVSCGSNKSTTAESKIETTHSLEGDRVVMETTKLQGIEMVETLNEEGTAMIKVPYKWYAGIGKADDKQIAIEMAENEARATFSRVMNNMVTAQTERGAVANNGEVQKALTSHWKQVSNSIQNACEPFGETKVENNPSTKMYTVTAKIGIRGDRFQEMLNTAGNYKPVNLGPDDLQIFLETNQAIMEAAKGN